MKEIKEVYRERKKKKKARLIYDIAGVKISLL